MHLVTGRAIGCIFRHWIVPRAWNYEVRRHSLDSSIQFVNFLNSSLLGKPSAPPSPPRSSPGWQLTGFAVHRSQQWQIAVSGQRWRLMSNLQRTLQGRIHVNSLVAIRKCTDGICGPLFTCGLLFEMLLA